jgi:hypothetical protein
MVNIDRIMQHAAQRRALQMAGDERRLKACLQADASRIEQHARNISATVILRALGASVAHGMTQSRSTFYPADKAALRPHPSDAGLRPVSSPAGEVANKGRKWGGLVFGSFETGKR